MEARLLPLARALVPFVFCFSALAQGTTAFTYQGRLNDSADPANGIYDVRFGLYDAASGGTQQGNPLTNSATGVSNGLFTVTLDFGNQFPGADRWLELGVRTNGSGAFTLLAPRQKITATPYAVMAGNVASGGLATGIYASAVTLNNPANQISGAFTGDGRNVTNVNAATLGGLSSASFWGTSGNIGTVPGTQFLGTADNQPFELRVNNHTAWRLAPSVGIPNVLGGSVANSVALGAEAATIAGGGLDSFPNRINASYATIGGGTFNTANGGWATIAGGRDNTASGSHSSVAGGRANIIQTNADSATIGGGQYNQTAGNYSTVGGGFGNFIGTNALSATIGGGENNTSSAIRSLIGGGFYNQVGDASWEGVIAGGSINSISSNSPFASVGGGRENAIGSGVWGGRISGGRYNLIQPNATDATIGGGFANTSGGPNAVVSGGSGNNASGPYTSVSGGLQNQASGDYSSVQGGFYNQVAGGFSSINGGTTNSVSGQYSAIGGGRNLTVAADFSSVPGGDGNRIADAGPHRSVIGGGSGNTISGPADHATLGGGENNSITGGGLGAYNTTLGGGYGNTISGTAYYATIPGGSLNLASAPYSFAAGARAQALHRSAFVWADISSLSPFASSGDYQFCIRARGGVQLEPQTSIYFGSQTRQMLNLWSTLYGVGVQSSTLYFRCDASAGPTAGFIWYKGGVHNDGYANAGGGTEMMHLVAGGLYVNGSLVSTSDRNVKENFSPINAEEVLQKVITLPISQWNYKADRSTPHIGPMAQDFYAAFNVGPDDKHIATVDADGVALAAIQGLNAKLEDRSQRSEVRSQKTDAELRELREENTELKQQNVSLEKRLAALEQIIRQQKSN